MPKIAILLCTYDGQHFLKDQLDSFAAQTYGHWEVWASDDGSLDDTHSILEAYRQSWGDHRLSIHRGPAEGFAANFLALSCRADIEADYYAYSDQDDIWESDKLERAVAWLGSVPTETPALYCSRTRLIDGDNNVIGLSPLFLKHPSFANALMQSIGGGNTIVFNQAARELLCEAGDALGVITHDWWVYMVVSGCGGRVFYDKKPSVRYRQHRANAVGTNANWPARLLRVRMLWQGLFRAWNDANIKALNRIRSHLTPDSRKVLDDFARARSSSLLGRLIYLKRAGVHRQTLLGNLGLFFAAIFNKI